MVACPACGHENSRFCGQCGAVRAAFAIRDSIGEELQIRAPVQDQQATPYVQRCRALLQASA